MARMAQLLHYAAGTPNTCFMLSQPFKSQCAYFSYKFQTIVLRGFTFHDSHRCHFISIFGFYNDIQFALLRG
jgi:hypothetical protein